MTRTLIHIANHAPAIFDRAEQASKKGEGVVSLILCATSIEAFIYDVFAWYNQAAQHNKSCPMRADKALGTGQTCYFHLWHKLTDGEFELCEELGNILASKRPGRTFDALKVLNQHSPVEMKWSEDANPYINYKRLRDMRNALVHMNGEVLHADYDTPGDVREGYPPEIVRFIEDGIIQKGDVTKSWIDLIDTEAFGTWSVNAAAHFMNRLIDGLPRGALSDMFREQARLM